MFAPNINENSIEVEDKFQRLIEVTFYSTIPETCAVFMRGEVPFLCTISPEIFQQFNNKTMNGFNNPKNQCNTLLIKINDEHRYFVDPKYFTLSLSDGKHFGTIFKSISPAIFDSYLRYCYTNEFWVDESFLDRLDQFLEIIKPMDQTVYKIKNYIRQITPSNRIRRIMIQDSLAELKVAEVPVRIPPSPPPPPPPPLLPPPPIVSETTTSTTTKPVSNEIISQPQQYSQDTIKEEEIKFKEKQIEVKNRLEAIKNQLEAKISIEEKTISDDKRSAKMKRRSSRRKRIGSKKYRRGKSKRSKKKFGKTLQPRLLKGEKSFIEMSSSEISRSKKSETEQKSPRKSKGIKFKPKYFKKYVIKTISSSSRLSQEDSMSKTFVEKMPTKKECPEKKDPLNFIDDFTLWPVFKDILINEPKLLKNYQKLYTCGNGHILIIQYLNEKNYLK